MYFAAGYSSHAGPFAPGGLLLGAEPAKLMLNRGGIEVMVKLSRTVGKMAFSLLDPLTFLLSTSQNSQQWPDDAQKPL